MKIEIDLGTSLLGGAASPAMLDLEELLATRLLVQGNSGSGKSHLLRRLLEQSAGHVQQVVIDPEGDFVSLGGALRSCRDRRRATMRCGARTHRQRASASTAPRRC